MNYRYHTAILNVIWSLNRNQQEHDESFTSSGGQGVKEKPSSYMETDEGEVFLTCCVIGCKFSCEFDDMADHVKLSHPEKWKQTVCNIKYIHHTQLSTDPPSCGTHFEDYPNLFRDKGKKPGACPTQCTCYALWTADEGNVLKVSPERKTPRTPSFKGCILDFKTCCCNLTPFCILKVLLVLLSEMRDLVKPEIPRLTLTTKPCMIALIVISLQEVMQNLIFLRI